MAGVTYGGRFELGPVHLGAAGFYGQGLGFNYALEVTDVATDQPGIFRRTKGYYVQSQVVLGKFDLFAGWGISQAVRTYFDLNPDPTTATPSVIKYQMGINGGVVFNLTPQIHFDLDYFWAKAAWYLGERQALNVDLQLVTGDILRARRDDISNYVRFEGPPLRSPCGSTVLPHVPLSWNHVRAGRFVLTARGLTGSRSDNTLRLQESNPHRRRATRSTFGPGQSNLSREPQIYPLGNTYVMYPSLEDTSRDQTTRMALDGGPLPIRAVAPVPIRIGFCFKPPDARRTTFCPARIGA
jgi:hypothetical protein